MHKQLIAAAVLAAALAGPAIGQAPALRDVQTLAELLQGGGGDDISMALSQMQAEDNESPTLSPSTLLLLLKLMDQQRGQLVETRTVEIPAPVSIPVEYRALTEPVETRVIESRPRVLVEIARRPSRCGNFLRNLCGMFRNAPDCYCE